MARGTHSRAGELRADGPGELVSCCPHALSAVGRLPSAAAVVRLVTVTMAGVRPMRTAGERDRRFRTAVQRQVVFRPSYWWAEVLMADGRDEEFRRFVAARSPALLRMAFLLTADSGAAEDVLQTALIRTYLRWRTIVGDPERYVRRVLITVAADEWRRPHHRRELVTDPVPEKTDSSEPYEQAESADRLRAALRALPPRQRAAVVLRHWVGLEVAEVAALLECSAGTVRSQTARGLDKLRREYAALPGQAEAGR